MRVECRRRTYTEIMLYLFEVGSIHVVEPSVSFTRDTLPPPPCSVRAIAEEGGREDTGEDVAAMNEIWV